MSTRAFLRTRYRVVIGKPDAGDHWQGGKPTHAGAICPSCHIPLLVLWDINCGDPRFPRRKFASIERLPLYFCWGCVGDLAYRVISPERIEQLQARHRSIQDQHLSKAPNFLYKRYPRSFERRPIALVPGVPAAVRRILANWNQKLDNMWISGQETVADPMKTVSARDKRRLVAFFGHPVNFMGMFHHQFGGRTNGEFTYYSAAGGFGEDEYCPNEACPRCPAGKSDFDARQTMGFLAGVLNDPWGGLPMIEPADENTKQNWTFNMSVGFRICSACLTIHACNRCD
ncbi:MAG: hypothetical protein ACJ8F7_09170 [Gemmataceae bacterium]